MKSTGDLIEEHENIAIFLEILGKIVSELDSKRETGLEDIRWLFEFNRDFVLKCHFGKEEQILFPALEGLSMPSDPLNLLIAEHDMAWSVSKVMRGLIEECGEGSNYAIPELIELGKSYISLMKEHISNEESVFYPLANEYLSNDMDDWIAFRFRLFTEERIGIGRYEDLLELLQYLKTFYGL